MAKVKGKSLLQSQREKLKAQREARAKTNKANNSKPATSKAKPTSKVKPKVKPTPKVKTPKQSISMGGDTGRRGGTNQPATAKSKVPTQGRPRVSKVGSQIKTASKLSKAAAAASRVPGIGQVAGAISVGAAIGKYMVDNVKKNTSGSGRGTGRKAFAATKKSEPTSKKSTKTPMKKSPGMAKGASKELDKGVTAANSNKSKLSPKQKTIAKKSGNPNKIEGSDLKKLRSKPKVAKKPASTAESRAYAKDSRNKEYDRLRRAGKTKEAAALGKKIASERNKKKKRAGGTLYSGRTGMSNIG